MKNINICKYFSRLDCIVIWGHGFEYIDKIIEEIRSIKYFQILNITKKVDVDMKSMIKQIYSNDYAPIYHLKSKLNYLQSVSSNIMFIIIKNDFPNEDYFGEGKFRHIESVTIRNFKNRIRKLFNPRDKNNNITHDHIIHITDNEHQTQSILKNLGYNGNIKNIFKPNGILKFPYYITEPNNFYIKLINVDELFCHNSYIENNRIILKKIKIKDSIQYRSLQNNNLYEKYIQQFRGIVLNQDYSLKKYLRLKENMSYLLNEYSKNFIIVKKIDGQHIIIDGLHRASIFLHRGEKQIKSCVYE